MYGYMRRLNPQHPGGYDDYRVPPSLPVSEMRNFLRLNSPYTSYITGPNGQSRGAVLRKNFNATRFRNNFVKEGTLKPVTTRRHRRPANAVPAKIPPRGYIPTLKEIAWASPKLAPMSRMNNEQLNFLSELNGRNYKLLKPKRRATPLSNNNYTSLRRQLAAFKLQRAWKRRTKK